MHGLAPHCLVSFGLQGSLLNDFGWRAVSESLWPTEDLDVTWQEKGSS
jgi:hypothetical protein